MISKSPACDEAGFCCGRLQQATGTVRHVTPAMKKQVCQAYGISAKRCNDRNFEIDHLIPLELAGSNEQNNLWPRLYRPSPGRTRQGCVRQYLHWKVGSGEVPIETARHWKQMVNSPVIEPL